MLQQEAIWQELERFNICHEKRADFTVSPDDPAPLLELAQARTKAEMPHAMGSVLMRNAAFIFVARLYMLSRHRLAWKGESSRIGVRDHEAYGRWSPQWVLGAGEWVPVTEEQAAETLCDIVCTDCGELIRSVAAATRSSQVVLWENVWGYLLWMYTGLFKEKGEEAGRAKIDLKLLLEDEIWRGTQRRSPFQKFLNGMTPEKSVEQYARVTCCLFYLVPGNEKCSYCPKLSHELCLTENE
ncbi:(2Fe-2S)-binding protein [Peribacillus sp. SCS-37]|uniref:(2Fe-2S)-binding protein n=1 Tax=Paraperibacillus esterisolvens TaxID=3115296 RepID=UPI0039059D9D